MKICVAQTKPVKGDIPANIEHHKRFIQLAIANRADLVIFPELSLTGYEPSLAKQLAVKPGDASLQLFQNITDAEQITIGVGMPLKNDPDPLIGMILFQPDMPVQTYLKQYLHPDEYPYFIQGPKQPAIWDKHNKIALAICYELCVPEHSETAYQSEAKIYIASVAKTASGVENAIISLSEIASKYEMTVLMSNCVGWCDGVKCAGNTSAWNNKGALVGQLNDKDEGLLILDTESGRAVEIYFQVN